MGKTEKEITEELVEVMKEFNLVPISLDYDGQVVIKIYCYKELDKEKNE